MLMPIGGDISNVECPNCETLMIHVEYKYSQYLDESELGLYCEKCQKSYEDIINNKKGEKNVKTML